MRKELHLNEKQFRTLVRESVKKYLKEANSYGWEVDTEDAQLAYQFMCEELGYDALNEAIVRAMGNEPLSEIMAYLLRMYDMRGWEEYRDSHRN